MATEPPPKCFFIFDDFGQSDYASPEEVLLYFYPEDYDLNRRLFLQGGTSAMLSFAKNFSEEDVSVIKMGKVKLAIKTDEEVVVVLSGDIHDSDSAITNHLNLIMDAFRFFNGSFPMVLAKHKDCNRKQVQTHIRSIVQGLMPLIQPYFSNTTRSFELIHYTELPEKSNRFFVGALQLLSGIAQNNKGVLGGVVTYEGSTLATQLDFEMTRFVLCNIEYWKSYSKTNAPNADAKVPYKKENDVSEHHVRVYMRPAEIEKLKTDLSTTSGMQSPTPPSTKRRPVRAESFAEFPEVFLCTLSLEKLSIGFLVVKSSVAAAVEMDLRSQLESKMFSLERSLNKCLTDGIFSKRVVNGVRIPIHFEEGPQSCYNYLQYESLSHQALGSSMAPTDPRFSLHVTNSKNAFEEDSSVSQVLLRDYKHGVYARKMLGKEVYFMPNSTNPHDLFMDHIEKTAQKSLKNDCNINFF